MSGASAPRTTLTVQRRSRALPLNSVLWILLCAAAVVLAHAVTQTRGYTPGEYWSGAISLLLFVILGWYSVRKRSLWFSVRMLSATSRVLPPRFHLMAVVADRLESWRAVHITLGVLTFLPLWWHLSRGLMSTAEMLLAFAAGLLLISGLCGVVIQEFLPPRILTMPEHEVRLEDVAGRIEIAYVEAEEMVLGHQETLIQSYVKHLKPILEMDRSASRWRFLWATLARRNPGLELCVGFRSLAAQFGDEAPVWNELVDLTARKINLEHNAFNLHFSTDWLRFHIVLALSTYALVTFHVISVLYFYGL